MPFDNSPEEPFDPMGDLALLRYAKGLINTEDKWTKGVFFNNRGGYCAVAALSVACTGAVNRRLTTQGRRLARHLCREMPYSRRIPLFFLTARVQLIDFNDRGTTHDDMMHLFDHAIDRLYHTKLRRAIESY